MEDIDVSFKYSIFEQHLCMPVLLSLGYFNISFNQCGEMFKIIVNVTNMHLGILSCAKLRNAKLLLLPRPKVGLI